MWPLDEASCSSMTSLSLSLSISHSDESDGMQESRRFLMFDFVVIHTSQ